jgi:hypothetical protein
MFHLYVYNGHYNIFYFKVCIWIFFNFPKYYILNAICNMFQSTNVIEKKFKYIFHWEKNPNNLL